jgi:hypothetical protein
MTDSVNYCHPAVTRVYSTKDLVEQLFVNLRTLGDGNNSFVLGYLSACLADIAEKGVDELTHIVDFTNQQVEANAYNKRADARRDEWANSALAD